MARICSEAARSRDAVARYGGEEFAALPVDTDGAFAVDMAERIRARLEATPLVHGDVTLPMTLSIGVAWNVAHVDSMTKLLAVADAAMYAAKGAGRNRVAAALPLSNPA